MGETLGSLDLRSDEEEDGNPLVSDLRRRTETRRTDNTVISRNTSLGLIVGTELTRSYRTGGES